MSEKLRVSWLRKHLQGVRPGDGVINSCEHVLGQSLDVRRRAPATSPFVTRKIVFVT